MKAVGLCLLGMAVFPSLAPAQRKEYVELQRDVALLQDQVRTLQRSLDEKMAALTVLVQQSLDSANKANTAVAVLDSAMRDRMREQEKSVAAPVAGVGTKVDQMASEFQAVRESIMDMTSRLGRLEQKMVDLGNAVKTIQAPPAPPPTGQGAVSSGPPPGVSAESLYQNALRDKNGGNLDIALQEFNDYLRYFADTETAPNAQFYIGEIFYTKGELESALEAFDMVLEKFSENPKTPDAHLMKGMTLVKLNRRNDGAQEFYTLLRRFPRNPAAAKARAQLRAMGLSATPPKKK